MMISLFQELNSRKKSQLRFMGYSIRYTDPVYPTVRAKLAVLPEKVLPLENGIGLTPELVGLKGLWDSRQAAKTGFIT